MEFFCFKELDFAYIWFRACNGKDKCAILKVFTALPTYTPTYIPYVGRISYYYNSFCKKRGKLSTPSYEWSRHPPYNTICCREIKVIEEVDISKGLLENMK